MTHEDAIPSPLTDETSRTVFRDRGEIIAALTARNAELEATLTRVRALGDAFADDGIARYGGNIAWHIEEAIANEKGDFPDAADRRIASQRDRADAAEATLAKVAALHTRRSWDFMREGTTFGQPEFPDRCDECRSNWPCNTVAVLASAGRPAASDGKEVNAEARCRCGGALISETFHGTEHSICGDCERCGECGEDRPASPVVAPALDPFEADARRLCDKYRDSLPDHVSTKAVWTEFVHAVRAERAGCTHRRDEGCGNCCGCSRAEVHTMSLDWSTGTGCWDYRPASPVVAPSATDEDGA